MSTLSPAQRLFVAIDTPDASHAARLARELATTGCGIKLGLEFFSANGPAGVEQVTLAAPQAPLFLDLKFHDIPNTVAAAVRSALALNPFILNVHAGGGAAMMKAAADAAARGTSRRPMVIAVTVLTSLDDGDLTAVGQTPPAAGQVTRLAKLTKSAGLDGVVCSAHEAAHLRATLGPDFKLIVPGIRPAGSAVGDQKRVMGPADAIRAGADILVVGRPITEASHPIAAAHAIIDDIAGATGSAGK
ncbi:MAG TPA: orotidine-5'-phosphate decarboxylase [Alphaproteobacteria bacterium]|jgi:orotidine-5'-phosphate decarboxylase|nr:orotidine-5'-phosphate decarboxylase [Alphaproteobacteria bacterium]